MFFPRSKERGFIEARMAATARSAVRVFPRSKERGFIEATDRSFETIGLRNLSAFKRTRLH